jgi:MoxR-like ATPase
MLWGMPGAVKTSAVDTVCQWFGLPCEILSPGERGEGAFGVVPVPMKRGNEYVISYPRPEWTDRFAGGRGVVFVDEIPTAAPAIKPALLGLLLARRIGGTQLPPGVRVIGAGNPPDMCAGYELTAAEANRLGHITWDGASVDEHLAHMAADDGLPKVTTIEEWAAAEARGLALEARVLEAWPDAWSWARSLEAAFLRSRPTLKNVTPNADSPALSRAWPSDRSWKLAVRALASSRVHNLDVAQRDQFVAGFIGEGVAHEFFNFIESLDLPDVRHVLDGSAPFNHSAVRLDRTVAVITGATGLTAKDASLTAGFIRLLASLTRQQVPKDLVVPALHTIAKARSSFVSDFRTAFPDEFKQYTGILMLENKYASSSRSA